jgi:N-acetyl-anhydromuramyl-L-alanine amidase AmpD
MDKITISKCSRTITDIIVHCSATPASQKCDVSRIDQMHKDRGFQKQKESGHYCGYHYVILLDGTIQTGRTLNEIGAHCQGHNAHSIGVCYIGGLDDDHHRPADTRTEKQKESLRLLLSELVKKFGHVKIAGHRDYSPDLNHDGCIEKNEWLKQCPCFDAIPEYKDI